MSAARRLRILEQLVGPGTDSLTTKRLVEVCRDTTHVTGASIMLVAGDEVRGSIGATDAVGDRVEELQMLYGEGPCVDADRDGRPALEPDLAHPREPRWVAFTPPAVEAGVRAIYAFPLRIGAVRLGALDLYCDNPGDLSNDQHADALLMADVAAMALVSLEADIAPGLIARNLERSAALQHVVHQATGMVAAQLDESVSNALLRLRGRAFATDRSLIDVATDVVERRIRFDPSDAS